MQVKGYGFHNYVFYKIPRVEFFRGYPQKPLIYLVQNLGVEATTDGCSRQCTDCGVNPPKIIKVMPFWMPEELAPLGLRIIPYLRGEPFDYFDPERDKDIRHVVEENFRFSAQTQITTAFWDPQNPIAARAARAIDFNQVEDFRLSIHLFWPAVLLKHRQAEIFNGCQVFWERGLQGFVTRVTTAPDNEVATRQFFDELQSSFPGLFLESRTIFVPIVKVGRTQHRAEADIFGEVFFNKLVLLPEGSLSVFHRKGNRYVYQPTGLSLLESFDPEKFRNFVLVVQKYLPIRAQGYQNSAEFLAEMKSCNLDVSPELREIVAQDTLKEVYQKFLALVFQISKMDSATHKFCHDLFSFDEPEIQEMVSFVINNEAKIEDIEVIRRALEFVLRKDKLKEFSREITALVIRRVFGRGVIDAETSFSVSLLDVLGFLPENKKLIEGWLEKLPDLSCTDPKVREKIRLALQRLLHRIDFLTSGRFSE